MRQVYWNIGDETGTHFSWILQFQLRFGFRRYAIERFFKSSKVNCLLESNWYSTMNILCLINDNPNRLLITL